MGLRNKTILITGGSQGIGRFLAICFAKKGARIVIAARNAEGLAETASMVRESGGDCADYVCDLCQTDSLTRMVDDLRSRSWYVDVLVNNAADVTSKPFLDTSIEELDHLIETNVTGALRLCRLVAPMMIEKGSGVIINISSLAGYKPNPTQTVYSISKYALNGISEALQAELRDTGVSVVNVATPSVSIDDTPRPGQVPVARFASAIERAIETGPHELYFSTLTKWLMRTYRFLPALARLRRG